jgi:hypothetical protein
MKVNFWHLLGLCIVVTALLYSQNHVAWYAKLTS